MTNRVSDPLARTKDVRIERTSRLGTALDAWRGFAALLVVVQHSAVLVLRGHLSNVAQRPAPLAVIGNCAVTLFFVLSGYLVGGSVLRGMAKGWNWRDYLLARGTRLWIVLLPALILGAGWDLLGTALFPHAPVYTGFSGYVRTDPTIAADHVTLPIFLANAAFLQGAVPLWHHASLAPPLGSNFPLWSLMNEFWYYALFPVALLAFRSKSVPKQLLYAFLALAIVSVFGYRWLVFMLPWLFGAFAHRLPGSKWLGSATGRWSTGAAALAMLLIVSMDRVRLYPLGDLALSAVFAVHLRALASLGHGSQADQNPARRGVGFFAGMSYTLYLAHMPLLVFATAAIGINEGVARGLEAGLLVSLGVSLAIAYSIAVWWLAERNTDALRAWLAQRLSGRPAIGSLAGVDLPEGS